MEYIILIAVGVNSGDHLSDLRVFSPCLYSNDGPEDNKLCDKSKITNCKGK